MPDLGFPAGKNKTIVIDLSASGGCAAAPAADQSGDLLGRAGARHRCADVAGDDHAPAARRRAELRYRGFSATTSPRGEAPETPHYDRLAEHVQRWRDLRAITRASAT